MPSLLPEGTLAALLFLAAVPAEVVNEEVEYVLSQIAERKEATNLLAEDIVIVPLAMAADARVDARTFLAAPPIMFVRLVEVPQHIMTYGTCAGFYGPVSIFPFTIGDRLKFCSRIRYTQYTRYTRYSPIRDIRYTRFTVKPSTASLTGCRYSGDALPPSITCSIDTE